jgi:4-amino-4-deoxy-L-arabinose transferase-like glycosyltransferase
MATAPLTDMKPTPLRSSFKTWLAPALIVFFSAVYKLFWLARDAVPFNGDEAIVALMARHILQGERPVFFYGQAYLGVTDAWLVALSFSIFGESVVAIRIVHIILFAGVVFTTYLLAKRFMQTEWGARAAMLWLALPPTMVTLYTTATLGGYTETLLFGNLLLLMTTGERLLTGRWRAARWLLFGILAGFAFYTFPLILIYLVPIGLWLLYRLRVRAWRNYLTAALGFAIGSAPWWLALIQSGGVLLAEMTGAAVAGTVEAPSFISSLGVRLIDFFYFGLAAWWGVRFPWAAGLVFPILGALVIVFYVSALIYAVKRGSRLLWGMIITLGVTYLITPFGGDPSGRYFLPLFLPLAIFTAMLLQRIRKQNVTLAVLLLIVLLGYNVGGTWLAAATQPPGITTQFDSVTWIDHTHDQELIDFLVEHSEMRGYTTYWVQPPIAFLSQERIISAARLPYHLNLGYTARDDRYLPYTQAVRAAPRAFYITVNHPPLNALIRERLAALNVSYQEQDIGNYHIFYGLARKVEPEELGIGDVVTPQK